MVVNDLEVNIIDLEGRQYNINSIHPEGNNAVYIVIKKPGEHYITKRKARELIEKVNEQYR